MGRGGGGSHKCLLVCELLGEEMDLAGERILILGTDQWP